MPTLHPQPRVAATPPRARRVKRVLPPRRVVATPGFSLIELLVVISLIGLMMGLAFPFLQNTLQNTAVNSAAGQVNNAMSAARVYATRNKSFVAARRVGPTIQTAQDNGDGYSGTIVLFAPDNSLRVMENDQNAYDPSNLGSSAGWLELQVPPLNGYTPIPDLEDLRLPGRVRVLGITRTGPGAYAVQLIPPPFAIRFARDGTIGQGSDDRFLPGGNATTWDRVVYVSPDGNEQTIGSGNNGISVTDYDVSNRRASFPNANVVPNFGPNISLDPEDYARGGELRMDDGRIQLPLGSVETVSGVLVLYPDRVPEEFRHPGTNNLTDLDYHRDRFNIYSPNESAALLNWASENGTYARIILFNRYTGQDLTR